MARTSDPNSATSQFYICDGAQHDLDDWVRQEKYGQRGYAAFGVTIEGMEVVRNISSVETTNYIGLDDWPVENITINKVTILD
jgi:peptidyl-prolyl cis-trans isomerase B (cyclophilin B)